MNLKHITVALVISIGLTSCLPAPTPITNPGEASVVPMDTPVVPTDTLVVPTEPPQPTDTPPPFVEITNPADGGSVECINNVAADKFCLLNIEGNAGGVNLSSNVRLWVFIKPVNPPGAGWYFQKSPATIKSNGDWKQSPSYLGSTAVPAVSGHTFTVRVALVTGDATLNGSKLDDLAVSGELIVLNAIEEISGIIVLSDPIDAALK
jgi:hypothetical protein